jgi:hypothetical protein
MVLGLGKAAGIDEVEIHWPAPSKRIDRLTGLPLNRYVHVLEGKGFKPVSAQG